MALQNTAEISLLGEGMRRRTDSVAAVLPSVIVSCPT